MVVFTFVDFEEVMVYGVSSYLTWSNVNTFALVDRTACALAIRIRQTRVLAWKDDANEGERAWIRDFQSNGGRWWDTKHHKWLRTLRYRHIVPGKFVAYATVDKRLCETWRRSLLNVFYEWGRTCERERKIYYWYVLDVLSHTLIHWPINTENLRQVLSWSPRAMQSSKASTVLTLRVVPRTDGLRVFEGSTLVGFVDECNRLWRTVHWSDDVTRQFEAYCKTPLIKYCGTSACCLGCGLIEQEHCKSVACAQRYATLFSALRRRPPSTTIELTSVVRAE